MNIGHEQIGIGKIAGFERYGTTYDVGIVFYKSTAISVHALLIIEMLKHIVINITCGLLNTKQYVVYTLYSCIEHEVGIAMCLLAKNLMRVVSQHTKSEQKQHQCLDS